MKRWKINEYDSSFVNEFSKRSDLSPLALKVLSSRGISDEKKLSEFFDSGELGDPFLMKDMDKAVEAINEAVDSYDLICIYGDYDCDGVTATAILYSYLENIGANVMYHIPERSEGYGMSISAVEKLAERGVKLIVTVDNGISAVAEAEKIYELGMKLVVTDHHQPGEILPRAEAVVDAHRRDCPSPYKDLAGAGVALKLCIALNECDADMMLEQYSDICSIGTIADIVPLTGENRTIVRKGLAYLRNTENYGLDLLMERASVNRDNLNSTAVSFQISPRINASGRFGSPITAVKALLSEDEEEAEIYVDTMVTLNDERKKTESDIMKAILHYIDQNPHTLDRRVLILSGNNWHNGVIGIVAARLLELFDKPTILISIDKNGVARGSARSMKGFNIFDCLSYAQSYLEQFGGHECAGGLTVLKNNIVGFIDKVYEFADRFEIMPSQTVECDMKLEPSDITIDNIKGLSALEPFGAENVKPVFAVLGARVERIISLSQGKHTKLELSYGNTLLQAPLFGVEPSAVGVSQGSIIDAAVNLDINEFNGRQTVNARMIDYRLHGINQDRYFNAKDCYEKFSLGADLPKPFLKKIDPSREELIAVYKTVSAVKSIGVDELYFRLRSASMNYCKLRIIIDAFAEKGLADLAVSTQKVSIIPATQKVDLEETQVLKDLRSRM